MLIMGIDPGYAITGYGFLKYTNNTFSVIDYGAITTKSNIKMSERLIILASKLEELISKHNPSVLSLEELFYNKNAKTVISVGQARGVVMLVAAKSGLDIFEYTPLQVKQSITGYGKADKLQIQNMVKIILKLPSIPKPDDVADALAIAICHGHSANYNSVLKY